MLSGQLLLYLSKFPISAKVLAKLLLGVACISLFINYQPTLGFPPVKKNIVQAQTLPAQTQQIQAKEIPTNFQLPFPGYLSTPFSTWHPGIDIATGLGMPIKPIAKGTVLDTSLNIWGLGLVVEIDHGGGYHSLYAHLGKIYVKKGQDISETNYLGEVGLTGHTSGPHTHLEVTKDGVSVNPQSLLPKLRTIPVSQDFISLHSTNSPSTVTTGPVPLP